MEIKALDDESFKKYAKKIGADYNKINILNTKNEIDSSFFNQYGIDFYKDSIILKREIININFLVNSLFELSKIDSNSIKFVNKKEKVQNIINESIKNVAILADLKIV